MYLANRSQIKNTSTSVWFNDEAIMEARLIVGKMGLGPVKDNIIGKRPNKSPNWREIRFSNVTHVI